MSDPRDGIGRGARSMTPLDRAAQSAGYRTLNLDYPSRRHTIDALAAYVEAASTRWANGVTGRVHVITHSMGGLVARAVITRARPSKLGRVVMLGPPNQGSELADLLGRTSAYRRLFGPAGSQLETTRRPDLEALLGPVDFELGIIAGMRAIDPISWAILPKPNDGKVSVARTRVDGMRDHIVLPTTHSFMMQNQRVITSRFGLHPRRAISALRHSWRHAPSRGCGHVLIDVIRRTVSQNSRRRLRIVGRDWRTGIQ